MGNWVYWFWWRYKEYTERVSKAITTAVAFELKPLGITTEYQKVISPKYYNFSNDSIDVKYTLEADSFETLVNYCKLNIEAFETYLKETEDGKNYKKYFI